MEYNICHGKYLPISDITNKPQRQSVHVGQPESIHVYARDYVDSITEIMYPQTKNVAIDLWRKKT